MRAPSPVVRGMLWMAASGLLFTVLNAILKRLSQDLDPWLVGFLRYCLGAMVILAPALRLGLQALWPAAPKLQLLRGVLHAGGIMLWFTALPFVTLPELTAIGFTGPIFICLGAVLFLGEHMTRARWAAVIAGFLGVLLVVVPVSGEGFGGISAGALFMLASSPVFAGSFLVAKILTRHDRSDVVVLWQHLWTAALLLPFAFAAWSAPNGVQWLLLVVCGFFGAAGHYCTIRAFRIADISSVQSVKFLELVWAALLGLAIFGNVPTLATVLGGVVILGSTLWLARREAHAVARSA
jgi:drug/metabolite transporter (DMT)-like permease